MNKYFVRYKIQGEEYCVAFMDLVKAKVFAKRYNGEVIAV